eukprot:RCo055455
MDQLAEIRREQAKRFAARGGASSASSSSSSSCAASSSSSSGSSCSGGAAGCTSPGASVKPRGKVICGKYFASPPSKLTMPEMESLLNTYVRITPQKEATLAQVRMDADSAEFFQSFLQRAQFRIQRFGLMLGSFDPASRVVTVDCIYEPRQAAVGTTGFSEIEDPLLDYVLPLGKALGLQVVGWIFSHLKNRGDYVLSAAEVLKTAELAAKFGPHCVVVSVSPQEGTGHSDFHPYQVSEQCVRIYQEGTLSPNPTAPHLVHSERELEAVNQEKSDSKHTLRYPCHDVDTALFILPLPIVAYRSEVVRNRFSRLNRPDHKPTVEADVRTVMANRAGEPFYQVLSDFH